MMDARPERRGMGRGELGARRQVRGKLGAGSRVPPIEKERRGQGEEQGVATGAGCACEARARRMGWATRPSGCEERQAQRRGRGVRASRSETGYACIRVRPDNRALETVIVFLGKN